MSTLKERIAVAFEYAQTSMPHINKSTIAHACGVTPGAVSSWFNGRCKVMKGETLKSVADFLGVDPWWLSTGAGEMIPTDISSMSSNGSVSIDSSVSIRFVKSYSVLNGVFSITETDPNQSVFILKSWAESKNIDPSKCFAFLVSGDSMEPDLCDGDVVLVDTSQNTVKDGSIYLISNDDQIFLRSLSQLSPSTILVEASNKRKPYDFVIKEEQLYTLKIIGRVVLRICDI